MLRVVVQSVRKECCTLEREQQAELRNYILTGWRRIPPMSLGNLCVGKPCGYAQA